MKRRVRILSLALAFGIIAALGLMAVLRLAPVDATDWHLRPDLVVAQSAGWRNPVLHPSAATDGPQPMPGGAHARVRLGGMTAAEALRRLDAVALAAPRTRRLAGSPEEGRITWETRSAFWGFPDYTTAEALQDGAVVHLALVARLRFGAHDFGVNGARLQDWLLRL